MDIFFVELQRMADKCQFLLDDLPRPSIIYQDLETFQIDGERSTEERRQGIPNIYVNDKLIDLCNGDPKEAITPLTREIALAWGYHCKLEPGCLEVSHKWKELEAFLQGKDYNEIVHVQKREIDNDPLGIRDEED